MSGKLTVVVLTPTKQLVRSEADMVVAPSAMGEIGILPEHLPLVADLRPGIVEIRDGAAVDRIAVSGGFVEVDRRQVTVLVETAERQDDIDVEHCRKAMAESEIKMKDLPTDDPNYQAAWQRLERNRARVELVSSAR